MCFGMKNCWNNGSGPEQPKEKSDEVVYTEWGGKSNIFLGHAS